MRFKTGRSSLSAHEGFAGQFHRYGHVHEQVLTFHEKPDDVLITIRIEDHQDYEQFSIPHCQRHGILLFILSPARSGSSRRP